MLRKIWLLACAGGGIWGAMRLVETLAHRVDPAAKINFANGESALFAIPIAILGALIGGFVGGMLYPSERQ